VKIKDASDLYLPHSARARYLKVNPDKARVAVVDYVQNIIYNSNSCFGRFTYLALAEFGKYKSGASLIFTL